MPVDLTLAMIVRDGAATLGRCLESVNLLAKEVVVMDTGSQDDTVAIARSFGARVFEMKWPDAYDEARNAVLDQVATEWVLVLDDDEWLAEGAVDALLQETESSEVAGYYLTRRDLDGSGGYSEMGLLRLWRHRPDIRFRGIIHEQVYPDDIRRATGLQEIVTSAGAFWHDGYTFDATETQELNEIRMIKNELEVRPNQLYYQCMLACLEIKRGLPQGPIRLRRIVQLCLDKENDKAPPHPEVMLPLAIALSRVESNDLQSNRTRRLATVAWKWFNDCPQVLYAIVELERKRGQVKAMHQALMRLAQIATTGTFSRHRSFDSSLTGTWLWANLMQTARAVGDSATAVEAAKRMLEIVPDDPAALNLVS